MAARTGDLARAEDALAEAFVAALAHWPTDGVPERPDSWLLTAARRKLIDDARSGDGRTVRGVDFTRLSAVVETAATDAAIPDERLQLLFACAHPAIDPAIHTPLMLQSVLGLEAADIGRALLVNPTTMGQRLVRAKQKIRAAGIRFEVPRADQLGDRLHAVLEAVYAAFGCGWEAVGGSDGRVSGLAAEAVWLGRVLLKQLPNEPEVAGLLALMLHSHARRDARRTADGRFIPLGEQDVARWHASEIDEAERLLLAASRGGRIGRFQLEAAIQSAHNARRQFPRLDWPTMTLLYEGLVRLEPSVGALVSRAVVSAEAYGPVRGLELLDAIDPSLTPGYQPYWAARGHLLAKLNRATEAEAAFTRAIGLTAEPSVRAFLLARRAALLPASGEAAGDRP